jgi:hypothetical protein
MYSRTDLPLRRFQHMLIKLATLYFKTIPEASGTYIATLQTNIIATTKVFEIPAIT